MYISDGSESAFFPTKWLSQCTEYMFVEDVVLDPHHYFAVSEQNWAKSMLIQPLSSGTDSQGDSSVFSRGQSRLLSHEQTKIPFGFI